MNDVGYQKKDPFIDYKLVKNGRLYLRDTDLDKDAVVSCLGSANTFGRFVETPYSHLLRDSLGENVYNMGIGGIGPTDKCLKYLIPYINNTEICILEVMSGRSISNPKYECIKATSGINLYTNEMCSPYEFWKYCIDEIDSREITELIDATMELYLDAYTNIIEQIEVPIILVYSGLNTPRRRLKCYKNVKRVVGSFPQLIRYDTVDAIAEKVDYYIENIGDPNVPHKLHGVTSDGMVTNSYYTSQYTHDRLAKRIEKTIRGMGLWK